MPAHVSLLTTLQTEHINENISQKDDTGLGEWPSFYMHGNDSGIK